MKRMLLCCFLLILTSCLESKNSSSGGQAYYEDDAYLGPQAIMRMYRNKSTGLEFVTEFLPNGKKQIDIPKNILKTDTEDRTKPAVPAPVDLFMKVYNPSPNMAADFYYEIPVLASPVAPSNVTTALSWILRWSFGAETVFFTKNDFDQIVREVELRCTNCRSRTSSEVVQFVLADGTLSRALLDQVRKSNPSLLVNELKYTPPAVEYAYSTTLLATGGKALAEITETQKYSLELIYINPLQSEKALKPEGWTREFQGIVYNFPETDIKFESTYVDAGFHVFKPQFSSGVVPFSLELTVNNKNRLPLCDVSSGIRWKINRTSSLNLLSVCQDPDPEDGLLLFNAVSIPPGLTVSSDGVIKWLPTQFHYTQKTSWTFRFGVSDPQLGYSEHSLQINLEPDNLPVFTFEGPGTLMVEGQDTLFRMSAVDIDGDPLNLRAVPVTPLQVGLPIGSGNLGNILRSGLDGNYSWDWTFMPGYLQTVGGDGTMTIKFIVSYDPANPDLDSSLILTEHEVVFTVENRDDPPVWQAGIAGFEAKEGVTSVVMTTAFAVDPSPGSSGVTYAVAPSNQAACNWSPSNFSLNLVGGLIEITMTPEYQSPRECMFDLVATDSTGLASVSSSFLVEIEDTNQPVTKLPTAPTYVSGKERERVDLLTLEMFEDLDLVVGDVSESLVWQCFVDNVPGHLNDEDCFARQNRRTEFRPSLGGQGEGTWIPSSRAAGTYYVRLIVTDKGGTSATHDFEVYIEEAPGPQEGSLLYNGTMVADMVRINEGEQGTLTLRVAPPTEDAIDLYDYVVAPGVCSVVGSGNSCPSHLLTPNGGFSGSGEMYFNMDLKPNYMDGNNPFPASYRQYIYMFSIYKQDQPNLRSEVIVLIQVDNVNRPPTGLKGSGCTNCTLDNGSDGSISITINAATDSKTGPNWKKNYGTTFSVIDPDTNDDLQIEWSESSALLGSINDFIWSFKLPSCVNPSATGSVVRTLKIKSMDSRGAFLETPITLTIQKATANSSCLQ